MTGVATLFLAMFFTLLAFWQKSIIIYALTVPVLIVYGFTVASEQEVSSPLWVAGVAIGILGLYFLYQIGLAIWAGIKARGG